MRKILGLGVWLIFVSVEFANLVAPLSASEPYYIPLGDLPGGNSASFANGISADGSVVVGFGSVNYDWITAFRWDATNGMAPLTDPPVSSAARSISANGEVVVGDSDGEAFRWDAVNGMVGLGFLPGGSIGSARDVSADGGVVVGYSSSASSLSEAFRWDATNGMVGLGDLPGGDGRSWATGVSADGSVVVGYTSSGSDYEAFRWDAVNGMVGLGYLPGETSSEANAVSANGDVVVGESGEEAFRWDATNGMVSLGDLPGGSRFVRASGISADGSVVVGDFALPAGLYRHVFRWDATNGMQDVMDLLWAAGIDTGPWRSWMAYGVSSDGSTIVGQAYHATSTANQAWVAYVPVTGSDCVDSDEDGYGSPANPLCTYPQEDCDDSNLNIFPTNSNTYCNCEEPYPEGTEENQSAGNCMDGMDNDCDGMTDIDPECGGGGLCDPDPCQGIPNAVAGTCTEIGGSCAPPSDFACDCVTGSTWLDAANTCLGPVAPIPGGCFDMGDHYGEGYMDELPVHNVCISAFEMDVHEVTNAEYAACVDDGACTAPDHAYSDTRPNYYGNPAYDNFPVIYVDWYRANAYCTWAGKRLPTEAEWEYAARGGLAGKRYPWGDTVSGSDANYLDSGDPWDNDTSQVEYYAANGYGLYDMAGNVFEWVNDWYQSDYYDVSPTNDPPGPATGTERVLRCGSWSYGAYYLRVAYRYFRYPVGVGSAMGFRCAR